MASEEFPSNSRMNQKPPAPPQPKTLEKVVEGTVQTRRKPVEKKVAEWGMGIIKYVLHDILIPAARDTAQDAGEAAIRRAFNPSGVPSHRRGHNMSPYGGNPYVNYGRMANKASPGDPRALSREARTQHKFEEIIFGERVEAEHVLDRLIEQIAQYDAVSVHDLYSLSGITSEYTDQKYGWTDLRSASVHRVKGGYLINLPRPEVLD